MPMNLDQLLIEQLHEEGGIVAPHPERQTTFGTTPLSNPNCRYCGKRTAYKVNQRRNRSGIIVTNGHRYERYCSTECRIADKAKRSS